jgi:hypothetical protein
MKWTELQGSEVEVNHCVIINESDRPCGGLVAVVMRIVDGRVYAKYLNRSIVPEDCSGPIESVTPVGRFGYQVVWFPEEDYYECIAVAGNSAKYLDGAPRQWQEQVPVRHKPRRHIARFSASATPFPQG